MENQLTTFVGQPLEVYLPSHNTVTIREQNGNDDETLSQITGGKEGDTLENMNRFIAGMVTKNGITGESYMTPDQVRALRLKDKYYLLLASRIHSLGTEVKFTVTCTDKSCKHEMSCVEDLTIFDTDLSKYNPEAEHHKKTISPYSKEDEGPYHEFVLTASQRRLRFKYLTGEGEKKALEYYKTKASKNTELIVRELSIWNNDAWRVLGSFDIFSAREMKDIRDEVDKWDSQFVMASDVECPKCGNEMLIPLNAISGFFYL